MTLKEREIAEQISRKYRLLYNKKSHILNHFTVEVAKKRAKEIADKRRSDVILIDITDKSHYVDTIRPNLKLVRGGRHG